MPVSPPRKLSGILFKLAIFGVAVPYVLFQLGPLKPEGGDYTDVLTRVEYKLYYFAHAPLVTAAHRVAYLVLRDWGWWPEEVVAASSSLAGGLFFAGLWRVSRNWRFWAVMVCSSLTLVFVGHVENYAWPYALTFWGLLYLREVFVKGGPTWPVFVLMGLGTFCHPMVAMTGPGILWALYPIPPKVRGEIAVAVIVFSLFTIVSLVTEGAAGFWQEYWLLPLFRGEDSLNRYSIFSFHHLWEWSVFMALSMPLGPVILAHYKWWEWRGWKGGLSVCFLCTFAWSFWWEPGLGPADWDLFAWPSLFLNFAAGLTWVEETEQQDPPRSSRILPFTR
jgi:hypothetical protein